MPGFSVGKAENKLGICASSTCPLNLDQVKVHSLSAVCCSAGCNCHSEQLSLVSCYTLLHQMIGSTLIISQSYAKDPNDN